MLPGRKKSEVGLHDQKRTCPCAPLHGFPALHLNTLVAPSTLQLGHDSWLLLWSEKEVTKTRQQVSGFAGWLGSPRGQPDPCPLYNGRYDQTRLFRFRYVFRFLGLKQ